MRNRTGLPTIGSALFVLRSLWHSHNKHKLNSNDNRKNAPTSQLNLSLSEALSQTHSRTQNYSTKANHPTRHKNRYRRKRWMTWSVPAISFVNLKRHSIALKLHRARMVEIAPHLISLDPVQKICPQIWAARDAKITVRFLMVVSVEKMIFWYFR